MRISSWLAGTLMLFVIVPVYSQSTAFPPSILADTPTSQDFELLTSRSQATILIDEADFEVVKISAGLFSGDVERVTGFKPSVVTRQNEAAPQCVIIGSLERNKLIKKLVADRKIDVSSIAGQWESCLTQVVPNPLPGIEKALVIAGSDRRGTAYGVFELSKQIGVSPWYFFADATPEKRSELSIKSGRYILESPSVKYRGIFINDEMWGIRPWAQYTFAPEEGLGLGPKTYRRIFELLLRLKANILWPAMHQNTRPFNCYPENRVAADEFAIIMGSSHIEPMLRNNIAGAEWDREYPGESWDYIKNRKNIYKYWEDRVIANGKYENMYTLGKRGKDDEAGTEITVQVLSEILQDQRRILRKWVNRDVTKVPQVLIPYTEVLDLYNKGLEVPDDVIICWPDDNFGNIRQLPGERERRRSGGSGVYYHFQWLNGATTAYPWTCTTPLGLTWSEMKKAYDFGADKLWVVNVGDIKPAEINIEFFLQMAWDIDAWDGSSIDTFLREWSIREFGPAVSDRITPVLKEHYELGYARRPESMVMWNARESKLQWDWFSTDQYDDEAQIRMDRYQSLINQVDGIYESLPVHKKDAFFEMVTYNVKGTALHNIKVLNAQKSHLYGQQGRASAAVYAAKAQQAEDEVYNLINTYNRELVTVGSKWDRMASLPGPWGGQWHQWDMPPLSMFSGDGEPAMKVATEGGNPEKLPVFSFYQNDKGFIDLFNTGNGALYWSAEVSDDWIRLSKTKGVVYDEERVWVDIDWSKLPKGLNKSGLINLKWTSSADMEWMDWDRLTARERELWILGQPQSPRPNQEFSVAIETFNPIIPAPGEMKGFVEGSGYISLEAEHFSRSRDGRNTSWKRISGLGRTGSSLGVYPTTVQPIVTMQSIRTDSPSVEYDIFVFTPGTAALQVNCIPGLPITPEYGRRIAVAVDNGEPQILAFEAGKRSEMDNLMTLRGNLSIPAAGQHVLKIWMVDPGVVIDKIIIDFGGVKRSYLGPPESYYAK